VAAARRVVLVVDDDEGVRSLVRSALERASFDVVEAASAEDALQTVSTKPPHLAVLDVVLPQMSGYELFELLREQLGGELPVIFVSGVRVDAYDRIVGLLLGADDYVVKPFDPDELVARVRRLIGPRRQAPSAAAAADADSGHVLGALTPREREILEFLALGSSTHQIAHALVISPRTVGTHVQHILGKLGVQNRGQAVALAYRAGLGASEVRAHAATRVG
jgi:DNA-binding NarL/FixJ family response regulator